MRLSNLTVPAAIAAILATAPPVHAWDDYGHELVAYVAYQDLKPDVKVHFNALLRQHIQYSALAAGCPEGFDRDQWVFMRAATWPDMVRAPSNPCHHTDHHPKWHYINIPVELDGVHGPKPIMDWKPRGDPENAVQALAKCETDLKDPSLQDPDKSKELCWFLHVVGDLHQPLHATALFSDQFPNGDEGGNLFWVAPEGHPVKLHAYWDQVLGTSDDPAKPAERAQVLLKTNECSRKALADKLAITGYTEWAKESADLSQSVTYDGGKLQGAKATEPEKSPKDAPPLPKAYHEQALALAEKQVVLAGYRLADKLNQFAATPHDDGHKAVK